MIYKIEKYDLTDFADRGHMTIPVKVGGYWSADMIRIVISMSWRERN
tara:strand:+ start:185 stop:325 length:141 start_codon:yes stop_codon:yes gene_type:complete